MEHILQNDEIQVNSTLVTPSVISEGNYQHGASVNDSTSVLKKKLRSADKQLFCIQALCEADLRAVISNHEDLAERQQSLLEDINTRLKEATGASDLYKKIIAKVNQLLLICSGWILITLFVLGVSL